MFLRRVTIQNVRSFRETLSFDLQVPSGTQPSWTLLLGDNGTGKTTVLRSIAMGLCDETSASGLLRELRGDFISKGEDSATITLELQASESHEEIITITTVISRTSDGTEEVNQTTTPDGVSFRTRLFASAYGSRRAVFGSEQYERYRLIDSLYTLFNYDAPLLNPEVYLYRLEKAGVKIAPILRRFETVLLLPSNSVKLDRSGFVIKGPWGDFVPVGAIGDGYASTLSWMCDLFGWSSMFKERAFTGELEGIVLLDELEQHLHPSWQRQLVHKLAQAFPAIQFIATTHAPLIAIGSAQLHDDQCQLILLQHTAKGVDAFEKGVVGRTGLTPPRGRRADQVLTSYLFGLASTSSDDVASSVARYSQLSGRDDLTPEERREKSRLHKSIMTTLGDENELQNLVRQAVSTALADLAHEQLQNGDVTSDALDLEVRRQLRELFGQMGKET